MRVVLQGNSSIMYLFMNQIMRNDHKILSFVQIKLSVNFSKRKFFKFV
jgi:hypothetical protein